MTRYNGVAVLNAFTVTVSARDEDEAVEKITAKGKELLKKWGIHRRFEVLNVEDIIEVEK